MLLVYSRVLKGKQYKIIICKSKITKNNFVGSLKWPLMGEKENKIQGSFKRLQAAHYVEPFDRLCEKGQRAETGQPNAQPAAV